MDGRPPLQKTPADAVREAEERRIQDAIRLRRWRERRLGYALVTIACGIALPVISLGLAGSIHAGGFWAWIAQVGWLPLVLTIIGGALAATLVFLRGWGVSLGMISFGVLFVALIAVIRAVLGDLLPALPGLVAMFVTTGAVVGHLTMLEEGD